VHTTKCVVELIILCRNHRYVVGILILWYCQRKFQRYVFLFLAVISCCGILLESIRGTIFSSLLWSKKTGLAVGMVIILPDISVSDFWRYTVSQITQSHFYFYNNFGKCGMISTIFSPLHFVINCGRGRSKRSHLTTYVLPHYLVKFECLIVQLFIYDSHSIQRQTFISFLYYKLGGILLSMNLLLV